MQQLKDRDSIGMQPYHVSETSARFSQFELVFVIFGMQYPDTWLLATGIKVGRSQVSLG